MQFQSDVDLAKALAKPDVVIEPFLEIDWNRDGLYTHAYSDMSKLVSSVDVDFPSIHGDIPAEINTIVGASSAVMNAKLNGRRDGTELLAAQLFSDYYTPSPLISKAKKGTPIRYTRLVKTDVGFKPVRQFTGWIVSFEINEDDGMVSLTCSDIHDLQTAQVTLPRWARGPAPTNEIPADPFTGAFALTVPINAAWVYGELLRQGGRSLWPEGRWDACARVSCAGSYLPSIGSMGDAMNYLHSIADVDYPFGKGQYGIDHIVGSQTSGNALMSGSAISTSFPIYPSNRGSGDAARYTSIGMWFYSDGAAAPELGNAVFVLKLDSTYASDPGRFSFSLASNGFYTLQLSESSSTGSSMAGSTWFIQRVSGSPATAGWHYIEAIWYSSPTATALEVRLDGVVWAPNAPINTTTAYTRGDWLHYNEFGNSFVTGPAEYPPVQHVEVCHGVGSSRPSLPNAHHPTYVNQGRIAPAAFGVSWNRLHSIPEVKDEIAWDVLREAVSGELGVMFTREDGQLWIMGRPDVYLSGQVPVSYNNDPAYLMSSNFWLINPTLVTSATDDISYLKIRNYSINPSANVYRNRVSASLGTTMLVRDIVWQSSDPKQFYAASGTSSLLGSLLDKTIGLADGVVAIFSAINATTAVSTPQVPVLNKTTVSAIDATNVNFAAAAGWAVGIFPKANQREFQITWGAGALSPGPIYLGAILGANQANLQIGGYRYEESRVPYVTSNAAEVTAKGVALLDLGSHSWRQDSKSMDTITMTLLRDTVAAAPVIKNLSVPVDPRRQLLDTVKMPPSKIVSGDIYAQVIGKRIHDTPGSAGDSIDVRVMLAPVNIGYWDDPNSGWDSGSWAS